MIRSSRHSIKFANEGKKVEYHNLLKEYRRVANVYLDYLWDNPIYIKGQKYLNVKKAKYDYPKMLSTIWLNEQVKLQTFLTARMQKCCITQVCGILGAVLEKQRKRQYIINQKRANKQPISKILRKRSKAFSKPDISKLNPEINSICCNLQKGDIFDLFVQICCYTNKIKAKTLNIPLKHNRVSNKWRQKGKTLNSILLTDNNIQLRFEVKNEVKNEVKDEGIIISGDQGYHDVLTLSDGSTTPKKDNHGHSQVNILKKMSKRKSGSKGFKKAKDHLKNFVNWSINQLNWSSIKELRQEEIKYLKYKNKINNIMKHWSNPLIMNKLKNKTEEEKVFLKLQSCAYRSQRCSSCGLVLKSNRKGKEYCCANCGLIIDADHNAAINHQHNLPDVPAWLRKTKRNVEGFFWKSDGFFTLIGEAITVPHSTNELTIFQ